MARAFPNRLPGKVPVEVARAFRKLKKLPDEYSLWASLPALTSETIKRPPEFLLIWRERFGFLITVANTSQGLAESALQGSLFSQEESITVGELGQEESEILARFSSRLPTHFPLRSLVLFPNVDHNTIDTISLQKNDSGNVHFLGLQQLGEAAFPTFLESIASPEISDSQLVHLRREFSPEVTIPESFLTTKVKDRRTDATLSANLLDFDQEWCMKNQLYLPEETESLLKEDEALKTQLVTGVAGSGKSLVLLYRALINTRLNPQARILILTHNRPINNELRRRFEELSGGPLQLECHTFFQWAARHLGDWPERTLASHEPLEILEKFQDQTLSSSFLADEIGFIKDHSITKRTDYLALDRVGRDKGLSLSQRERIWKIYRHYQRYLKEHRLIDWHGVAMRFHHQVTTGQLTLPGYHCILIDEAQFFAKAWFDIVRAAMLPGGQLFLAADPTQGFLKRRQSWLASGIDVRGRTTRLHHAYRNSRRILQFASDFFSRRLRENPLIAQEDLNPPTEEQLASIQLIGQSPEVITCANQQDLHLRAANEVQALHQSGFPSGQLLILHANSSKLAGFEKTLGQVLGNPGLIHGAKSGTLPEQAFCQTCTLLAATGLESPIVFLLGLDDLLEHEADPLLTHDQWAELHATHTSLLYMAFTRAGQRLVIFSRKQGVFDLPK